MEFPCYNETHFSTTPISSANNIFTLSFLPQTAMESMLPSTESSFSPHDPGGGFLPAAVKMAVRLWLPDQRRGLSDAEQKEISPAGLRELIEDVAAARRGKVQTSENQVHISGLESLTDALVLSRLLQHGVVGFRRRSGGVPVSVSIAIDLATSDAARAESGNASDGDPTQISHESVSLLKVSRPAQVLLTPDSYQRLSPIAGLPLRSFPARFGVYEYLWTDESKLEQLQFDPQLALELMTAGTTGTLPTSAVAASRTEILPSEPQNSLSPHPHRQSGMPAKFFRSPVALGSSAAAMVSLIAAGVILAHTFHRDRSLPPAPPRVITPREQPPAPATQATPQPEPVSATRQATTTAARPETEPAKPKKQSRSVHSVPAVVTPPSGDCDDLATLEQLAENNRVHADLTDARRQFERVLSCDPNNKAARTGLDKTITAMGDR